MKKNFTNTLALVAIMLVTSPAFAQLTKGNDALNEVQGWLLGISAVVITIALMFVGFRMLFQAAQWKDVAPIFWGGVIIGGAPGIASMFI